ncbi:MAG: DUF2948 family protein [Alphaproteobacteria bacterium]|nr:DUF2948 family protein [Alphaproteobacteria bacterium]
MSDDLKISAADCDDLTILSACLQDAVVQVGDLAYLPEQRRFAGLFNRFRWERPKRRLIGGDVHDRIVAGVHFEAVRKVSYRGFDRRDGERVLELLAVTCEDLADGGKVVELAFAGDAAIRVEADRLAVFLGDRGEAWRAKAVPRHPEAGGAS